MRMSLAAVLSLFLQPHKPSPLEARNRLLRIIDTIEQ